MCDVNLSTSCCLTMECVEFSRIKLLYDLVISISRPDQWLWVFCSDLVWMKLASYHCRLILEDVTSILAQRLLFSKAGTDWRIELEADRFGDSKYKISKKHVWMSSGSRALQTLIYNNLLNTAISCITYFEDTSLVSTEYTAGKGFKVIWYCCKELFVRLSVTKL